MMNNEEDSLWFVEVRVNTRASDFVGAMAAEAAKTFDKTVMDNATIEVMRQTIKEGLRKEWRANWKGCRKATLGKTEDKGCNFRKIEFVYDPSGKSAGAWLWLTRVKEVFRLPSVKSVNQDNWEEDYGEGD